MKKQTSKQPLPLTKAQILNLRRSNFALGLQIEQQRSEDNVSYASRLGLAAERKNEDLNKEYQEKITDKEQFKKVKKDEKLQHLQWCGLYLDAVAGGTEVE